MLLMIDNYDSFTYNLVHYFLGLDVEVKTVRHDAITVAEAKALDPKYLVISPGPCTPNESGISMALIEAFAGKIPILGICLGHQCITQCYGGKVVRAPGVMHGKTSRIDHDNSALFAGIPSPFTATRYHSLIAERASFPACLTITATTQQQGETVIMALQHKTLPIYGVQFHPEAILTEQGHTLLQRFLESGH